MRFAGYLHERLQVLWNSSFSLYILSCLLAAFGHGLVYIALSWNSLNSGPLLGNMALLMLCLWGPSVILAPIVGWLVDSFPSKMFVLLSNLLRGVSMLLLAFNLMQEPDSLKMLFGFSLIIGIFNAFYHPAALVLIRQIVHPNQLLYANSTADCAIELGSVTGMGCAGIFLAFWGSQFTIMMGGCLFLASGFCLFPITLRYPKEKKKDTESLLKSLQSGLSFLSKHPHLQLIYLIQCILMMIMMTAPVLLAPYAKQYLSLDVKGFSHLEALFSLGAVLGGIFVPYGVRYFSEKGTLSFLWWILALTFFLLASLYDALLTKVIYGFVGFALSSWAIVLTKAQEYTPPDYQGRLLSLAHGIGGGLILLLYCCAYFFHHIFSISALYYLEAFLVLLCWVLYVFYLNQITDLERPSYSFKKEIGID